MKEMKKMLVMLGVLAVLLIAFFALRTYNSHVEEKAVQEEEAAKIQLTDISDLEKITYTTEDEKIALSRTDDGWVFEEEPEVALSQNYIETMETEIEDLTASQEIENPDELSYYGLEEPLYSITAKNAENSITIYVGNGTDSDYYLTLDDKEKIYTGGSSLVSAIQYTKNQLVENDTVPTIGSDQITKVVISSLEEGKKTYKASDEDNEDAIATVLGGVNSLSFSECTDYNVKEEELPAYGLDEDTRIMVTITYTDDSDEKQQLTIYIGNVDDTETCRYIQLKGSNIVNTALIDTVNNLLGESDEDE